MSTGILEFVTVFVLAAFVGIEVINADPSTAHGLVVTAAQARSSVRSRRFVRSLAR